MDMAFITCEKVAIMGHAHWAHFGNQLDLETLGS
jgi:hypothetical protein